jgi:iron complex transport system substrate-binding protein
MKSFFFIIIFFTSLFADQSIPTCNQYQGHPQHITGKSPAVNMLIQSIQGDVFPNQLSKDDPIVKKIDSFEVLVKNKIDLVVLWNANETYQNFAQRLMELHIDVCTIDLDTLEQYPTAIDSLGKIMQKESRAHALSDFMRSKLALLQSIHDTLPQREKVSVYYARGDTGLQSACSLSSHAEVIDLASGINPVQCPPIAKSVVTLNIESLLQMNPHVIITDSERFYNTLYAPDSMFKSLSAIKSGFVYQIPSEPMNWIDSPPSLLRLLGALWLTKKLYPEYATYDLHHEINAFKTLFLNQENE